MGIAGWHRWGAADGGAVPGRGRHGRSHSLQRGSGAGPGERGVTSKTQDTVYGANQGSSSRSSFSKVPPPEFDQCQHPEES